MRRPTAMPKIRSRLLLACVLLPLSSCALLGELVQKPTVSLQSVNLKEVTFQGLAVEFVLSVRNPNVIGADLARLLYQITVDGHVFAESTSAGASLHLPAQGTGTLTLPIGIRFLDLVATLQALFTKQQLPYTLSTRLGFGTPAGVLEVPLSTSGTFPVPRLPSVSLANASLKDINLSGATVRVLVGVSNPNGFALPLGNLQYAVKVAGTPVVTSSAPGGSLAAGGARPIEISAHLDFLSLGLGVARAIQAGGADFALDGSLDVGGYALPLHLASKL